MTNKHWGVTVEVDGERILTIESNSLAGKELSDEEVDIVRTAASHLLAFVGPAEVGKSVTDILQRIEDALSVLERGYYSSGWGRKCGGGGWGRKCGGGGWAGCRECRECGWSGRR